MPIEVPEHDVAVCLNVRHVLARVGDKWSMLVVMLLEGKPHRFSDLKRAMAGVSQRMLTHTLRGLERDGLVRRTVTPMVPPRVDYELTELGRSLSAPVRNLGRWATDNVDAVRSAREAFDEQRAPGRDAGPGAPSLASHPVP